MTEIVVYQKPTWSTCRKSVDFLKQKKAAFRSVDVTKTPPSVEQLREILRALGMSPREILRKKDPAYAELGLDSGAHSDAQLLELMSRHPGLIQRPIVVRGKKAVVARPVENIDTLLK